MELVGEQVGEPSNLHHMAGQAFPRLLVKLGNDLMHIGAIDHRQEIEYQIGKVRLSNR